MHLYCIYQANISGTYIRRSSTPVWSDLGTIGGTNIISMIIMCRIIHKDLENGGAGEAHRPGERGRPSASAPASKSICRTPRASRIV